MKNKILWLVLSCLMIVALMLASCAPAVVEEEEEAAPPVEEEEVVEEEVAPAAEEPQYGGSVSFIFGSVAAAENFDPVKGARSGQTASLTYETLGIADWTRGPGGTNEIPFDSHYIPDEFTAGCLAESWEVLDAQTVLLHIRQGVHFHNVPPVNGRELTADDVVYTWEREVSTPGSTFFMAEEEKPVMTKIDKWTAEIKWHEPYAFLNYDITHWVPIVPHEMVEEYENLNDWKHQCGTGPFMVVDCVSASSVTFKRNPDYWMNDPFYPENRLPYLDRLTGLVIVDESTQLAAIRTHKVDRGYVSWQKAPGLMETNPELLNRLLLPDAGYLMFMRTDLEPFSDVRVRQALSLAIDQEAIARDFYKGAAYLLTWPIRADSPAEYTPLEELPDTARELYEQHPDKARQLLAEAGYPDGFKTEVITGPYPGWVDVMSIVKEYLADVGVDMEIRVLESGAYGAALYSKTFPAMAYTYWDSPLPTDPWGWAHGAYPTDTYNFSNVVDPIAREKWVEYHGTVDPDERARMLKEENIRAIELVWEIPVPAPASHLFWTPWLKGYYGERSLSPIGGMYDQGVYRFVWLDQDLKYEITGIRE